MNLERLMRYLAEVVADDLLRLDAQPRQPHPSANPTPPHNGRSHLRPLLDGSPGRDFDPGSSADLPSSS